ncbi:MAG: DUF1822 family protein [Cyanobacteria bacterium J06559_3]
MSLLFDSPVQPVLDLPPDLAAWQHCACMPDKAARWRIYLHQLGAAALMPWFREEFEMPVRSWPEAAPWDIWHILGGLAITLGDTRIVLMLTEVIDAAELRVPQEWVDIPGWMADYYVGVYLNIDEQQLVLWGYTTYTKLKVQGIYDASERIYALGDGDLIQDFAAFCVAQRVEQLEAVPSETLLPLSSGQGYHLIQQLAQATEPRLEIPFNQWGALLSNEQWRQQLYQLRLGNTPINLRRWMDEVFERDWQSLKSLQIQIPALRFRSVATNRRRDLTRAKRIALGTPSDRVEMLLVLMMTVETDDRRRVRIQLYPADTSPLLPSNVTLTLELPDTGETLRTVQAGDRDNYIQLPPFRCPTNRRFRVRIQLADRVFQEDFVS